jgi:hypothetical protein
MKAWVLLILPLFKQGVSGQVLDLPLSHFLPVMEVWAALVEYVGWQLFVCCMGIKGPESRVESYPGTHAWASKVVIKELDYKEKEWTETQGDLVPVLLQAICGAQEICLFL